ncbi:hypothetical protein DFH09DRAFT_1069640 [Mycena vulgaris]|nr:hypothetical protein DFH09DRAFT_1069640 [Mycena vulgaris]
MLDITTNTVQELPLFEPSPRLGLVICKFSSKWVIDAAPCVASLFGSHDDPRLQVFHQTQSMRWVDPVPGILKDPTVLGLCTRLERFESETFPSDELIAAIPRTISALAVGNLTTPPSPPTFNRAGNSPPPPPTRRLSAIMAPPLAPEEASAGDFIQQLDSFPNLKLLTWVGPTTHPDFVELEGECTARGIAFHARPKDSVHRFFFRFAFRLEAYPISPS